MATATKDPVLAELQAYGPELLPGAAARLAGLWGTALAGFPPDRLADEVAKRLAKGGPGHSLRNPDHAPPPGHSPLRQALDRLARKGTIDADTAVLLAQRWAPELVHVPPV